MTRASPRPICTCDRCGMMFPHDQRLSLISLIDGEIRETAWLCHVCGMREGGVPEASIPLIAQLLETDR